MSRFRNALSGLFGNNNSKEEKIVVPQSFAELKVGNSFKIKICDVYEMVDRTLEIVDAVKYVVSSDHVSHQVLTVRCIDSGEVFRATSVAINGMQMIRLDKEMSTDEVSHVFFDLDWVAAESAEEWTDPTDFRFIFDENCNAGFRLKRFNMGEESVVKRFLDWTADDYTFHEHIGIQGYKERNGHKEAIQYYFLVNDKKDYGVVIENDEQGVARVYASHLVAPSYFIDFC